MWLHRTLIGTFWVLALLLCDTPTDAQDIARSSDLYPETRTGIRAAEFMAAYNSGDKAKVRKYLKTHMSPQTLKQQPLSNLVQAFVSIHEQLGKLEVVAVQQISEFDVVVKTKTNKADAWIDVRFSIDDQPPHHQGNLGITDGRAPDSNDYNAWRDLPDLLAQLRRETGAPSIAMAVIKDGKVDQVVISGNRKQGKRTAAKVNDPYHIGSLGKSMTASLIARLVDRKLLDWSTTIGEVVQGMEIRQEYRDITILQLLNHQGGVAPYVDDRKFERKKFADPKDSATIQRQKLVEDALNQKPVGVAGKQMVYSNAGYIIAGYIAEQATDTPFEELLQEYIFDPLELGTAGFGWPRTAETQDGLAGHYLKAGKVHAQPDDGPVMGHFLVPAGDLHCSIQDLAKYAAWHLRGLNGTMTEMGKSAFSQLHQPPANQNYAAGWMIGTAPDGSPQHFHNGSLGTFYAAVFLFPKHNAAVVVTTNIGMNIEPDILKAMESVFAREIK